MDLIADFADAIAPLGLDPEFRRWGGIVLTSALMGRDCWTSILGGMPLYGSLYVTLVADSGFGKSLVISAVGLVLEPWATRSREAQPRVVLAPQDTTLEDLVYQLVAAFPGGSGEERTRAVVMLADEIGVLFREDAGRKELSTLQAIYDMHPVLAKRTVRARERGDAPTAFGHYFTALWGATPAWVEQALPVENIGLGWPARTHFVVGHMRREIHLFGTTQMLQERLWDALGAGTRAIVRAARGMWAWSAAAREAIEGWLADGLPGFENGSALLDGYANRRLEHAGKLALVYAVARHPQEPVIELEDFFGAREAMEPIERDLAGVFALVGANPQRHQEEKLLVWARKQEDWFHERALRAQARLLFSAREVPSVVDGLVAAGELIEREPRSAPYRTLRAREGSNEHEE